MLIGIRALISLVGYQTTSTQATNLMTKIMACRPFGQLLKLKNSSLMVSNACCRRCSKPSLALGYVATGITIPIGTKSTRWLMAVQLEIVVLYHNGDIKFPRIHQVTRSLKL